LQFWLQFDPEILAGFPVRFTSIEAAREHCQRFFRWYNHEHATAA
jgi:transposase InsO family protein